MAIEYIWDAGKKEKEVFYAILSNNEKIDVIVTPTGSCFKEKGQTLDGDLTQIVLEEVAALLDQKNDPSLAGRAKSILASFGWNAPEDKQNYQVSREMKEKIKASFTEWCGEPDANQRYLLKELGLQYTSGTGRYGKIQAISNPKLSVPVSHTPKNKGSAGRSVAGDLVHYLLPAVLAMGYSG